MPDPTTSVAESPDLAHLERVLDAAPEGFVVVAADGRLRHANAAALRLFGLSRGDSIGRDAWSLLPAGLVALLRPGYDRVAGGRPVTGAIDYVEPLGRWLEVRAFPFEGGVAAFFADVTGRETEAQRRHFLTWLDAVIRPLGDPERIMEMAASAVGEHFRVARAGYAEVDEARGSLRIRAQYREGVPALPPHVRLEDCGPALVGRARSGRTLAIADIARSSIHPPGRAALERMGAASMLCVPLVKDRRLVAVFGLLDTRIRDWSATDIALLEQVAERTWSSVVAARGQLERDRLLAAVDLERARLRELFLEAPLPIAVIGTGSHVELANPRFRALFDGRPAAGSRLGDALPELAGSGLFEMIEAALANPGGGAAAEARGRVTIGDGGTERCFEFLCQPRTEADGCVSGAVLAGVDITEQVMARARVEALLRDVSEANQAKSEFLATISHELRTPLTAIVGYTEILETGIGGPLTDRQREHLSRIRLSSWHLLQLIEQILTFARVEAGREEVGLEVTELGSLVRETVALVQPTAGTKRLHISLDVPPSPLTVETDPGKVRQILLNLLSNAIKFTERGEIAVALRMRTPEVHLVVSDTGPGIPETEQPHVFEAFRQVGRRGGDSGAGLGLTITRRLAVLMGGDIELDSAPGRGSTFTVRLPARPR